MQKFGVWSRQTWRAKMTNSACEVDKLGVRSLKSPHFEAQILPSGKNLYNFFRLLAKHYFFAFVKLFPDSRQTRSIQPQDLRLDASPDIKAVYLQRFWTGRPVRSNSVSPFVMMIPERSIILRYEGLSPALSKDEGVLMPVTSGSRRRIWYSFSVMGMTVP